MVSEDVQHIAVYSKVGAFLYYWLLILLYYCIIKYFLCLLHRAQNIQSLLQNDTATIIAASTIISIIISTFHYFCNILCCNMQQFGIYSIDHLEYRLK